jgi:hypothetical protein
MARIVLGIGSSHGPQLGMPPEQWWRRADSDKQNPALWYRGKTYRYDDLVEERASAHFERELPLETMQARHAACQKAIAALGDTLAEVAPDVCVIVGDDQDEVFLEDNMPAMAVYWGETVRGMPQLHFLRGPEPNPTGWGRFPEQPTDYPGAPDLGLHLIREFIQGEFDVAHSRTLPPGKHEDHGIGHAFGYVYRRLMRDQVTPNVPIFLNTYYPPNQPSLKRCYELGRRLRQAIDSWDSDQRVALIASGGLSHFVIEEDLDQQIMQGLKAKDEKLLTGLPVEWFNSGTSEIRSWITVAGALADTDLEIEFVDYVPCYRSPAGTGCAMGFAEWRGD